MEKIRINVNYAPYNNGINNTEAAKSAIIRQLLYFPEWDLERIKQADLYLRLLPNNQWCSYHVDAEYGYISCVAHHGDIDRQYIVVLVGCGYMSMRVIGDVNVIDSELELRDLALNIAHASAECREENDLDIVKNTKNIDIHDVAAAKTTILKLVEINSVEVTC